MTPETATSQHLTASRRQQLGELAEFVADEYSPGDGPVDTERILREERVTLSYGNYEDAFDGLLEHKRGKFHVYCNVARCLTPTRKRFTLGHELGHYFIDEHREALRAGRVPRHPSFPLGSKNPAEKEADTFAASLVTPESRLRKALGKRSPQMESVLAVASVLQVSPVVVAGRFLSLDMGLLAAVFWNSRGYCWKYLSDGARRSRMLKTIEEAEKLPEGSPTALALQCEEEHVPFHSAGTTASFWFPHCGSSDLLIEEAVTLGKFGVLTLLRRCST